MISEEFTSAEAILAAFPDEATCISYLERLKWNGRIVSPFDAASKVYRCKNGNYRCGNSGKYFNVKNDSIFYNTRIPLQKWFVAIWLYTQNSAITSVALGKELQLTQKSAWLMLQRIKAQFGSLSNASSVKPKRRMKKAAGKIAEINVITEPEKLSMSEWLRLMKQ